LSLLQKNQFPLDIFPLSTTDHHPLLFSNKPDKPNEETLIPLPDPLWSNKYSRRNHLQTEEPSSTSLTILTNPLNIYPPNPSSPEKLDDKQKHMTVPFVTNEDTTKYIVTIINANSVTTMPRDIYQLNVSKTPPHSIIITSLDCNQDAPYVGKLDITGRNAETINVSLVTKTHQDMRPVIVLKIIETDMLQQTVLRRTTLSFLLG